MDSNKQRYSRLAAFLEVTLLLGFIVAETTMYSMMLSKQPVPEALTIAHHIMSTLCVVCTICEKTSAAKHLTRAIKAAWSWLTVEERAEEPGEYPDPELGRGALTGPVPPAPARLASLPGLPWQWREQVSYCSDASGETLSRQGSVVSTRAHRD